MHTHTFEQGRRECRPKASVAARLQILKRVLASYLAMSSRCIGCDNGNMRIHQEQVVAINPAMSNVCMVVVVVSNSSSNSNSNSIVVVLVEAYTHTFEQGVSAGLRPLWLVKSQNGPCVNITLQ